MSYLQATGTLTVAEEHISAEVACENLHNSLPRKRHARGCKYRDRRVALCLRQKRSLLHGRAKGVT